MDQRIDGCRTERVTADKQRMDRKGLPQQRMTDMAVHKPGDRAVAAQAQQGRDLAQHAGKAGEGLVSQLFKTDFENGLGRLQ